MANSTTNLDLIEVGQSQKELTANALFDASSPSMIFGKREKTSALLTWGYYGGNLNGLSSQINNGTVQLVDNSTNYIEADPKTGIVSVNQIGFTKDFIPCYIVTTVAGAVTTYDDKRPNPIVGSSGGGGTYTLPVATDKVLGGVKVGKNLNITTEGVLTGSDPYTLPTATSLTLGGIKIGKRLTVNPDGTVDADPGSYTLPNATASVLGGVKIGNGINVDQNGVISINLPIASATVLGGIKVGKNLSINASGVLDASGGGGGLTNFDEGKVTIGQLQYSYLKPIYLGVGLPSSTVLHTFRDASFSLNLPDNDWQGGNTRGVNTVDLQVYREDPTQVASGNWSAILGGGYNTVSGKYSYTMGYRNTITGDNSFVVGSNNTANGIILGSLNKGYFGYCTGSTNTGSTMLKSNSIVIGELNIIEEDTHSAGDSKLFGWNNVSKPGATGIVIGNMNESTKVENTDNSIIIGSFGSEKGQQGIVFSGGGSNFNRSKPGSNQQRKCIIKASTVGFVQTPLTYDGNSKSEVPTLLPNELKFFDGVITVKDDANTGIFAVYKIQVTIGNYNGNSEFVGDPSLKLITQSTSAENIGIYIDISSNGLSENKLWITCFHTHNQSVTFSAIIDCFENFN